MNKPLAFKVRTVGHYTGVNGGDIKKGTGGCGAIWYEDKTFTVAATQDQWLCAYPANNNYIYKKPNMNPSTKPLRYLSVCSGMEAASVAWHHLGWQPVGFSEIEPFPSAILKHHYPTIPNYGDLTQYKQWPIEQGTVDLLVGGTPCQAFSVAGLRKGLDDPRGNLALTFLGLAEKLQPTYILWENVPGVLSSNKGRDFGSFIGALAELGYGFAWRVCDAQYFGVPQRRKRVFLLAIKGSGNWRTAAEILFERKSLCGDIAESDQEGKVTTSDAGESVETGGRNTVGTLDTECGFGKQTHQSMVSGHIVPTVLDRAAFNQGKNVAQPIPIQDGRDIEKHQNGMGIAKEGDPAYTIDTTGAQAIAYRKSKRACSTTDNETWVEADSSNTLNNFDLGDTRTTHAVVYENHPNDSRVTGPHDVAPTVVSRFGTGGGNVPLVNTEPAVAFQPGNLARKAGSNPSTEVFPTLRASVSGDQDPHVAYTEPVVPLDGMNLLSRLGENSGEHSLQNFTPGDPQFTLTKGHHHGVITPITVRRLTPVECERLQGFPDNWSQIPWKGKPAEQCPDGPRYRVCGNSMAVPVMSWIGERIQKQIDGKL